MKYPSIVPTLLFILIFPITGKAQIRLPQLFQDSMILQRQATIKVWGWASAGEEIELAFADKKYSVTASAEGRWNVSIPAMEAGGPYTMDIAGKNNIQIREILIGDLWLCAGQSNMVHQLNIHDVTYAKDIAEANYPAIRHYKVPTQTSLQGPTEDLKGGAWQAALSDNVRPFSAVAYFFALKLYEKYQVPIGLINASVGGTPIEAWMSEAGFSAFPDYQKRISQNKDTTYVNSRLNNRSNSSASTSSQPQDKGLSGPEPWYSPSFTPKNWRRINIPGYWEDQGIRDLDGVVWYRRDIDLPQSMAGQAAKVFLGRIVDADQLYINGEQVGRTTYQYPQRRYKVRAGLLKKGKNTFVVRVRNNRGKGGFVPDKPYCIFTPTDTIDLKGYWQYKVGQVFIPSGRSTNAPRRINPQNEPTSLYNGMLAPYIDLPIKGILWYQGESNAGRPAEYADLLSAMVSDWRKKFQDPDLPFIYAQLPNFMEVNYLPSESKWAEFRASQLKGLKIPHTAMTVNIDLGEWNDIHPDNKKDVGERMALAALQLAYGEDLVYSGPLYKDHRIAGNRMIISFSHLGGGLKTKDGEPLSEFAIAGEDGQFVWAEAKIEGDQVVVWSEEVPSPKYVRYAWADNPDNPNLCNREGLPASPFQTQ